MDGMGISVVKHVDTVATLPNALTLTEPALPDVSLVTKENYANHVSSVKT